MLKIHLNGNEEYRQLFMNLFNIDYIDSIHVVKAYRSI